MRPGVEARSSKIWGKASDFAMSGSEGWKAGAPTGLLLAGELPLCGTRTPQYENS